MSCGRKERALAGSEWEEWRIITGDLAEDYDEDGGGEGQLGEHARGCSWPRRSSPGGSK